MKKTLIALAVAFLPLTSRASAPNCKDFFTAAVRYPLLPRDKTMRHLVLRYYYLLNTGSAIDLVMMGEEIRFYLKVENAVSLYKGQFSEQEKSMARRALARGVWKEAQALFF